MKEEEIKIRISEVMKKDFQDICENESTTMSRKINNFITKEINLKKYKTMKGVIVTKELIRFGVINGNGRLYTKDELLRQKFDADGFEYTELDKLNSEIFYGQFGYGDSEKIHKYNATHSVSNFRIEGEWLIGDVTILNDSITKIFNNLVFRPRSFGEIGENGLVKNLEIIGFDAIVKSLDEFK